jgi:3-deoxy-7-phosphoheptulonate synthase
MAYQRDQWWAWSTVATPSTSPVDRTDDRRAVRTGDEPHPRLAEALQQPTWDDPSLVDEIRDILSKQPPIAGVDDVLALRSLLASVWAGALHVLQAGDCAEDPAECTAGHVGRKVALLDGLAATLGEATDVPVLRVGRIAGQFVKPRSNPVERVGDVELPVYRGHMVNGPEPALAARRANPLRILACYMAASEIMVQLGWRRPHGKGVFAVHQPRIWTSHEALLLDYEEPMIRELPDGRSWLASTHWPWIGERTRHPDGAHVALLARVINPIGCKLGPGVDANSVLTLCDRLDPRREPGRLTFIVRMGADLVADRLPPLVAAVRTAGHPVIWMSDPMHANTVVTPSGGKTRYLTTIIREATEFRQAVSAGGGIAGGLHLETTPDDVAECLSQMSELGSIRNSSLCDPRLTFRQAQAVASAWASQPAPVDEPEDISEGAA